MGTAEPQAGKIAASTFARVIRPRLGRVRPEVIVGPRHGVDVGAVDLGGGQVLVATTDPLYVVPAYGWDRAAWFALHIIASDAATSGLAPGYISVDLNLPMAMPDEHFAALWEGFHRACDAAGIAVVTGHTGRYTGCDYPILGGATVFSVGPSAGLVTPAMARVGDQVIVTKGPAIETVGQLGVVAQAHIRAACGAVTALEAEALFDKMSVVADARLAAGVGVHDDGITGMHDATEYGLWGALVEVAEAAGVGLAIDQDRIPMPPVVRDVCALFGIDPYAASSEGTLVATCRPAQAGAVVARLGDAGIAAAVVGDVVPRSEGLRVWREGRVSPLTYPEADPFWPMLCAALRESGTDMAVAPKRGR